MPMTDHFHAVLTVHDRRYEFDPKPDITAHELAQIVFAVMAVVNEPRPIIPIFWKSQMHPNISKWFEDAGPSVKRHFREIPAR